MAEKSEKTQKDTEFDALVEEFGQRLRETVETGIPGATVLYGDDAARFLRELFLRDSSQDCEK